MNACNDYLPAHVKVGPYYIQINQRDDLWREAKEVYGRYHSGYQVIDLVTENLTDVFILDTLLHEIMHAIHFVGNLNDNDDEERIVTTMATGLVGVFVDNPDLVDYIQIVTTAQGEQYASDTEGEEDPEGHEGAVRAEEGS